MTAELIALTKELQRTTVMLDKVVMRLDAADKRANRHRLQLLIVAGCVVAVFLIGWWTFDSLRTSRDESRIVACHQDNDTAKRINGLNDRNQDLLRDALDRGDRTPAEQAEAQEFLVQQLAEYEALKVPLRDCSPAGIRAYYEGDEP